MNTSHTPLPWAIHKKYDEDIVSADGKQSSPAFCTKYRPPTQYASKSQLMPPTLSDALTRMMTCWRLCRPWLRLLTSTIIAATSRLPDQSAQLPALPLPRRCSLDVGATPETSGARSASALGDLLCDTPPKTKNETTPNPPTKPRTPTQQGA